jgi:hypothetical protein
VDLMRAGRVAVLLHVCIASAVTLSCTDSQLSVTAPETSKCQVAATSNQSTFPPSGGSGSIDIVTTRDCTWTIESSAAWIALGGERSRSGQGEAVVQYQVEANTTTRDRSGMLVVAESRIQIAQAAAPCRFELNPTREIVSSAGGSITVRVTTSDACQWSATSEEPWIRVTSNPQVTGSGTVALEVARNEGAAREGFVAIGQQPFTVEQQAAEASAPEPAPSPAPPPAPTPSPAPAPAPDPDDPIDLDGQVAGLLGLCPLVTFQLGGRSVITNLGTDYQDGSCTDLSNGDELTVRGTTQATGSLLAERIRFRSGGRDDDNGNNNQ